jgi:hypothetical protein
MIPDFDLADDGTMDTVFHCSDCGEDVRYSGDAFERDEDGTLPAGELERAREEHADECRSLVAYLAANATVELFARQDDIPVRGNALASGDDAEDKRCEDAILARLDRGDEWAWACVEVRASFEGWKASDFLGACSYDSESDFRQPGGYFEDMRETALRELAAQLEDARDKLGELFVAIEAGEA